MKKLHVLIVDDSQVMRRLITTSLVNRNEIASVDAAPNGLSALDEFDASRYDAVIIDLEMPRFDGIATLRALRHERPDLAAVIVTNQRRLQPETLRAFDGRTENAVRPRSIVGSADVENWIGEELIPKLLTAATSTATIRPQTAGPARPSTTPQSRIDVVVIGGSTGGPNALAQIIPRLRPDLAVPILVVQHMPAEFTPMLAGQLDKLTEVAVSEATDGAVVRQANVVIAAGNRHMTMKRSGLSTVVELSHGPKENSCRPSVDVLFRSAVKAVGSHVLAIVLTGLGRDGAEGARHVQEAGGQVLVQDESSSAVWGMPGEVIASGHADVVKLDDIADEIAKRAAYGREPACAAC